MAPVIAVLLTALTAGLDSSCNSLNVPDPGLANGRVNSQSYVFGVYTRFPMPGAQPDFFTRLGTNGVTYRLYTEPTSSPWNCAPVWRIADQSDMAYGGVVKILSNATDATQIKSTDLAVGLELYGRPPLKGLQLACMDAPTPAPADSGSGDGDGDLPSPSTGDGGGGVLPAPTTGDDGDGVLPAPAVVGAVCGEQLRERSQRGFVVTVTGCGQAQTREVQKGPCARHFRGLLGVRQRVPAWGKRVKCKRLFQIITSRPVRVIGRQHTTCSCDRSSPHDLFV